MGDLNSVKVALTDLIEKFKGVKEKGLLKRYDEANTCKDFILPLFELLGWKVYDRSEVTAQAQASKGKVDYAFCIQGIPKFFLEAKALKVDLDELRWAEQVINYAWHKGVVWAILTDFEGLKVFNAEWLAKSPQESIFFELKWSEYLDRFDQLWLLSKEAFLENRLDQEAERWGKKKTKTPVNVKLLMDMTGWRRLLATTIRRHHPRLSEDELDEAIQRILDRLIFIRTCEDRGLEPPTLQSAVREWKTKSVVRGFSLAKTIKSTFREFDSGYNSQIFAPHLCEDLMVDDEILEEILNGLYETKDQSIRYDFSAIDADVLGSMYEQYLGHILKKTPKRATVQETRQHRKAMGIYYTPKYIVDYIVKNTVGALLKEKPYREAIDLKILDPACGSGSFLIRAFEEMDSYLKEKRSQKGEEFDYFRRMEILNRNLYGVDLDKQAVEIAQLNLLLKALEQRQLLPVLKNIRQGNSLISDTEEELKKYFGKDWQSKHPFNWEGEYPEAFKDGGFDVIIGNPPYVRADELLGQDKNFWLSKFNSPYGKFDIYFLFIEKAINLLKEGGRLGFIVSNKFLAGDAGQKLRIFILNNCAIEQILDVSNISVFKEASIYPTIIILRKEGDVKKRQNNSVTGGIDITDGTELGESKFKVTKVIQKDFELFGENLFLYNLSEEVRRIIEKTYRNSILLDDIVHISEGLHTGDDEVFIVSKTAKARNLRPVLRGQQVDRYSIRPSEESIDLTLFRKKFPRVTQREKLLDLNKIVIREFAKNITAAIDENKAFCLGSIYFATLKETGSVGELKYIWALLNSSLIDFVYRILFETTHMRGGYVKYRTSYLGQLPIRKIDFSNPEEKQMHDDLVALVDKMLDLNKQLQKATPNTDRWYALKSEIEKTDKTIDQKVYELYGLTPAEIKLIEGK
jgi:type I restriction-modification system DNA methylase subunit